MKRSLDISETKAEINADELRLAQMGHTQELNRHFSTLSLIGLASTTTISWTGLGLGLITEIGAGGPGAVIYGFILVTILQCFLGASLAEFVSSYPTEGGMYHWIAAVAPRRATGILSFLTGWFSVLGWIFTTASTNIIYAQILMALVALYISDLEIKAWQTFIVYQGLNLLTAAVVMFGNKIIPALNKFSLFYLQIGWLVVLVTVVACAPTHRDPEFVFRTWINTTGWNNNAICFITGLVNPLYSLGGLDGVTHITEEMPNPSKNAPLAIAITLVIAFCTGLTYLISLMFSIQDFDQLTSGNTGMPLAELFRQVTQKTGGAFGLLFILFIALGPCVISSQLSTGRIFWAFSRDGAIPLSKLVQGPPKTQDPFQFTACSHGSHCCSGLFVSWLIDRIQLSARHGRHYQQYFLHVPNSHQPADRQEEHAQGCVPHGSNHRSHCQHRDSLLVNVCHHLLLLPLRYASRGCKYELHLRRRRWPGNPNWRMVVEGW
ncbi:related to choline transporter Hnm1 [Fusarium mangiferae]|uniref:Related to choline transporter Hnm1 n=1 Tax=Fusarium mangiferae TaxID=192010 RepID=A0A1L7UDG5_FUSMA|nr:uncharacterized protein FMAN_06832 [Fusarium mangiferae]CVL08734.1 related to choline transporter Hnm1 [Fusarium mangiferae]